MEDIEEANLGKEQNVLYLGLDMCLNHRHNLLNGILG